VRVIVRWQESTRPELEQWVQSLPGHDPERRALAQVVIDALEQQLIRPEGTPTDAVRVRGLEPPVYWWRAGRGLWLRFVVRETRRRRLIFFRNRTRKITILEMRRDSPVG
jgi:hypothetical protein